MSLTGHRPTRHYVRVVHQVPGQIPRGVHVSCFDFHSESWFDSYSESHFDFSFCELLRFPFQQSDREQLYLLWRIHRRQLSTSRWTGSPRSSSISSFYQPNCEVNLINKTNLCTILFQLFAHQDHPLSSTIHLQVHKTILYISQALRRGISFSNFPFSAIAVAVLCFPFGIIGCCMLKEKQCVKCNRSFS